VAALGVAGMVYPLWPRRQTEGHYFGLNVKLSRPPFFVFQGSMVGIET